MTGRRRKGKFDLLDTWGDPLGVEKDIRKAFETILLSASEAYQDRIDEEKDDIEKHRASMSKKLDAYIAERFDDVYHDGSVRFKRDIDDSVKRIFGGYPEKKKRWASQLVDSLWKGKPMIRTPNRKKRED